MHQPVPQPVINLYHKQVHQPCTNLYLNLYHQHMHQECTKYIQILHQIHINCDSLRCTNIINYTTHVCANSSTTCLNHIPKTYTNIIIKIYLIINHSIHKPNTINPYIKPCATTSLLCSLKLNQQLQ